MKALIVAGVSILALTGCSEIALDRSNPNPDHEAEATNVTVWRNVDSAPNVVTFCAHGVAWAATLNAEKDGRGQLVRFTEMDRECQG